MYRAENTIYLLTMLEVIEKIQLYTKDVKDRYDFFNRQDQMVFNACNTLLMVLGEEAKKLDIELRNDYPEIPWRNIFGFRNVVAHDYRSINVETSFSAIRDEIPPLKVVLIEMIGNTDIPRDALKSFVETDHYRHIGYLLK